MFFVCLFFHAMTKHMKTKHKEQGEHRSANFPLGDVGFGGGGGGGWVVLNLRTRANKRIKYRSEHQQYHGSYCYTVRAKAALWQLEIRKRAHDLTPHLTGVGLYTARTKMSMSENVMYHCSAVTSVSVCCDSVTSSTGNRSVGMCRPGDPVYVPSHTKPQIVC